MRPNISHLKSACKVSLLCLSASFLVAGCSFKTKPSSLENNATFRVDSVGGSVQNEEISKLWNIPTQRRFQLRACIKSLSGREDITHHAFEVSGPNSRAYRVSTDSSACLNWTEIVPFDYLAKPTFIKVKRVFTSLGKQRGSASYEFALNPWSGLIGGEAAVADLARTTVAKLTELEHSQAALRADTAQPVALEIERVDYQLHLNMGNVKKDANMRLKFQPNLILTDMSDGIERKPLESGKFLIKAYLVRLTKGDAHKKVLLHKDYQPVAVNLANGLADVEIPLKMVATAGEQDTFSLVVKLTAIEAPNYIADFERVYSIPEYSQLRGASLTLPSGVEGDSTPLSVKTYTADVAGLGHPADSAEKGNLLFADKLTGSQGGIPDENFKSRRVQVNMGLQIRYAMDTTMPAAGRQFIVYSMMTDRLGKRQVIKPKNEGRANHDGWIFWDDYVEHVLYQTAEFKIFDVIVEDVETKEQIRRCAAINPWDFFSTFFKDCVEVRNEHGGIAAEHLTKLFRSLPRAPLLKIDNMSFQRTDIDYSPEGLKKMIRSDLSLEVRHRYLVQVGAGVMRYDDKRTASQTAPEALRGGWWRLTIALFRNDLNKDRIGGWDEKGKLIPVTTVEVPVCTPGTVPVAEIELGIHELGLIDRNNYFAVQMVPLDEDKLKYVDSREAGPGGPLTNCRGGQVAADSPLETFAQDLISPPYTYQMNLRSGGSSIVLNCSSVSSSRYKEFCRKLLQTDLHSLHLQTEAKKKAQEAEEQELLKAEREEGWQVYAKYFALKPLLLKSEFDIIAEWKELRFTPQEIFKALECMDQNFWADGSYQATCIHDGNNAKVVTGLCRAVARETGQDLNCATALQSLLVEKKTHVFAFDQAAYNSGFTSNMTVTSGFGLGSFTGSDYGNAKYDSSSAGLSGDAGVGAEAEKGPVSVGARLEGSLSKSQSAFNINFTREWTQNVGEVISGATLTVENADIDLRLVEYRNCYILRSRVPKTPGYYVCGDISKDPVWRRERYFNIFNPGFNGAMLNTNDEKNRWLQQFRGERTFYYIMTRMNANFAPFNYDTHVVPVMDILKRSYDEFKERTGWGEPFILSSVPPRPVLNEVPEKAQLFERIQGTERTIPVIGFCSWCDFGNVPNEGVNDPRTQGKRPLSRFNK